MNAKVNVAMMAMQGLQPKKAYGESHLVESFFHLSGVDAAFRRELGFGNGVQKGVLFDGT